MPPRPAGFQTRSCRSPAARGGTTRREERGRHERCQPGARRRGQARTAQAPAIPDLTLPQFVLGDADRRGNKRALVDAATGDELSYAELADAVRETGAGLSARGLRPGDVLALCAPNCIEFAVAFYAAASAGAVVTTVNPACTGG